MIHDREYRLEVNFAGRLRKRGRVFEATAWTLNTIEKTKQYKNKLR